MRPDSTSTSPPRSRPRPIGRISKTPGALGTKTHQLSPTRCTAATGTARIGRAGRCRAGSAADADMPGRSSSLAVAHVDPDGHGARLRGDLAGRRCVTFPRERPARAARRTSRAPACPSGCAPRRARRRAPSARASRGRRCGTRRVPGSSIWPRSAAPLDHGARRPATAAEDRRPDAVGLVRRSGCSSAQRLQRRRRGADARRVRAADRRPRPPAPRAAARCARRPDRACACSALSASVSRATAER